MRSGSFIFIAGLILILLIDSALFVQLKQKLRSKWKIILYWLHSLLFVIILITYHIIISRLKGPEAYFWIEKVIGIIFLFYTPKSLYIIFKALSWVACLFSRLACKILRVIAWYSALLSFLILLFSITWGRYYYKIETVPVSFDQLPPAFDGYRIVQLADLHLGSYGKSYKGIPHLVKEVNALHPDLIVFTGDMVNNFSAEMTPWIDQLSQLKAKDGKYAVTGNHDYGDYTVWKHPEEKQANLNQFFENMKAMGFHMLNNDNIPLVSQGDTLYLAGVENWGKPPFPRYGKLDKALEGTEGHFVLLLTHDPSHWRAEVLQHQVPLTLSGHTHAMQMGIKIGNYEWSPAQYIYPEYDGLYRQDHQYLYVSRGQGYLGFPGRIGLRPVITEIILTKSVKP